MHLDILEEDLYPQKLAIILGRGKRLARILRRYPTEARFKAASMEEVGEVIGIKNKSSKIRLQLADLDEIYHDLMTPDYQSAFSICPDAQCIMGIDTEYLLSPLDSIQFVILKEERFFSGFIFTNPDLALAVKPKKGIDLLRRVIGEYSPEVIVGHNFNCDLTVLERVYEARLPELHRYDDTMKMARLSHVANIVGSAALKKLIHRLFAIKVVEIRKAYRELTTFVEYGLMDALFPIYLRSFFMTGKKPALKRPVDIDYMILAANEIELKYEKINFPSE